MLGIDPRAARIVWTVFMIVLLLAVLYAIRRVILLFVFAMFLAYLLTPVVDFIDRHVSRRRLPRNATLLAIYLVLLTVIGIVATGIGSRVGEEAVTLASRIPIYLRDPAQIDALPLPWWLKQHRDLILGWTFEQIRTHSSDLMPMLRSAGHGILSALGSAVLLVLVPILSFFFLKDAVSVRTWIFEHIENDPRRPRIEGVLEDVHRLLGSYIRALVLISLTTFVVFAVVLTIMQVPYSLLLSALAGVVEFIPAAGPLLAAAVILTVALFAGYSHLGWIVIFLVIYRLFLDYVLQPHFMREGVALPPLVIIFGVLAGEQIAGALGMFLSIPVLAILRILYVRYQKTHPALP
jgi:predicted PurR-regulated permease PerM